MSFSLDRLRFLLRELRERLWIKPLFVCIVSIGAVFLARLTDQTRMAEIAPKLEAQTIEALLSVMASSMLVIATFAVGSMLSAYSSAANTATPRSFGLIVADDVSQAVMSTFVGAFIFSVVALTAIKNQFFGDAGRLTLFVMTVVVFAVVILSFIRWVDRIARLGRVGNTIGRVEEATAEAMRHDTPLWRTVPVREREQPGVTVFSGEVGYVQYVDVAELQDYACERDLRVEIVSMPGAFATPNRPLAKVHLDSERSRAEQEGEERTEDPDESQEFDASEIRGAFVVAPERSFRDDPRFGLSVLSEIGSRALSPAVNDPGTAISVIGSMVRLFVHWHEEEQRHANDDSITVLDRVEMSGLSAEDMLDDAFNGLARDGAGIREVMVRLQKALATLRSLGDDALRAAAEDHARMALERAERAMQQSEDIDAVRAAIGS